MIRLNLGAGRAHLPTTEDNPFTTHLWYLLPETAKDGSPWVNVDMTAMDGIDEVIDLFEYPWVRSSTGSPWNTSTVEEIWMSHLAEHIPHQPRFGIGAGAFPEVRSGIAGKEGWYAFFTEAWRVLRPGGWLHVLAPYAFSTAGMSDPTHVRYLLPATFGYTGAPNGDAPFDYQIPCQFELVGSEVYRFRDMDQIVGEFVELTGEKPGARDREAERAAWTTIVNRGVNRIDEFMMTLEVVKHAT